MDCGRPRVPGLLLSREAVFETLRSRRERVPRNGRIARHGDMLSTRTQLIKVSHTMPGGIVASYGTMLYESRLEVQSALVIPRA